MILLQSWYGFSAHTDFYCADPCADLREERWPSSSFPFCLTKEEADVTNHPPCFSENPARQYKSQPWRAAGDRQSKARPSDVSTRPPCCPALWILEWQRYSTIARHYFLGKWLRFTKSLQLLYLHKKKKKNPQGKKAKWNYLLFFIMIKIFSSFFFLRFMNLYLIDSSANWKSLLWVHTHFHRHGLIHSHARCQKYVIHANGAWLVADCCPIWLTLWLQFTLSRNRA